MPRLEENLVTHVAITWGDDYPLLSTQLPRGKCLTLGGEGGPLALCLAGPQPLIDEEGRLWVPREASLRWLQRGSAPHGASPEEVDAAGAWVMLREGDRAHMCHGPLCFLLEVAEPEKRRWRSLARWDRGALWALGGSFALHGLFLVLGAFLPPTASALSLDLSGEHLARAQYLIDAAASVPPQPVDWPDGSDAGEGGEPGQAAPGEEGAAGEPDSAATHERRRVSRGPSAAQGQPVDAEQAATAGILQVLARTMNGPQGIGLFNPDTIDADLATVMGAAVGAEVGANHGHGGLGMRGVGRGGGGPANGTRSVGSFGTHGGQGFGPGAGSPTGLGRGGAGGPPKLRTRVEVAGSLSKEAIRRTIQRHLGEVRHCYEQGLRGRPELAGRVRVFFLIQPDGSVGSATLRGAGIGDGGVDACIVRAVRRWGFPRPRNGGMVQVTYPFLLQSSP